MTVSSEFTRQLMALDPAPHTLVVAFSGGVDSQVLLALAVDYAKAHRLGLRAVHINHNLSPNAEQWQAFCERYCQQYEVEFFAHSVQLTKNGGDSLEQIARQARYQVLSQYVQHGELLLTGQHLDDQAETFLLALKRGSGPKGLSAMPLLKPFANGHLMRPLLSLTRREIEAFARQRQLTWAEDESNRDVRFDRNFLRHQVLPSLNQRWPHFSQAVARTAQICAEQEALLQELLSEKLAQYTAQNGGLSIDGLANESPTSRRYLLRMWMMEQGWPAVERKHLTIIWQQIAMAKNDANPVFEYGHYCVRRFDGWLFLDTVKQDISRWRSRLVLEQPQTLPDGLGELRLTTMASSRQLMRPQQEWWLCFDPAGLVAHPVERGRRRKLKKIFQEYGVPSWQRRRIPIIVTPQQQVVAVAGLFVDRAFAGDDLGIQWQQESKGK
ncbi:tRNA lysidine(34) synthetase TilS [Vibrio sp. HB161653]|nr:tRNA lysidine(34) synthetase TilS [Vibrio sp. HB161653]MDP5254842.1 tRNA lysidine(34) synthetase TilS [Vibrio sp. HB161653]